MNSYSEAFKSKMVQRMLGPEAVSQTALSAETGIAQGTLSRWVRAARGTIRPMPNRSSSTPPPSSRVARRTEDWSAAERLRVLGETWQLRDDELGAYLRREGLHRVTLDEWRAAALEGLAPARSARAKSSADQKRVRELERKLRRKDRALAEAAALLVLQKKVQAIWGDEDDSTDPRSDE